MRLVLGKRQEARGSKPPDVFIVDLSFVGESPISTATSADFPSLGQAGTRGLSRPRLAEPNLEADCPKVRTVAGHQRAIVETSSEIARLGIVHDLSRVVRCLEVARD
jgi:hypothetical protein